MREQKSRGGHLQRVGSKFTLRDAHLVMMMLGGTARIFPMIIAALVIMIMLMMSMARRGIRVMMRVSVASMRHPQMSHGEAPCEQQSRSDDLAGETHQGRMPGTRTFATQV